MTIRGKEIISFCIRQIADIRSGGINTITKKFKVTVYYVIKFSLTVIYIPFALIIRFFKPLMHIRFGKLISQRIGHLAFEPEMYLCEKDMKLQEEGVIDLFYCSASVANNYLLQMWRKKFTIVSKFIIPLDWANRILPGSSNHIVPLHSCKHEDIHGLLDKLPQHLEFSHAEELCGQRQLRLMGIPSGAKYICFYSRDSAYLDKLFGEGQTAYHNYRDSNINNYLLAARTLAEEGYYLIRMGAIVKEPLTVANPMIIDYANNHRSDFMDIYLLSKCIFFITANSGPCAIATIFRRPNAFANVAPFLGVNGISRKEDIFIPKKYLSIKEKRFLTFDEILKNGAASFYETNMFVDAGIKLIENTAVEIKNLATEMDARLKGTWHVNDQDATLYNKYNAIFEKNGLGDKRMPHIATSFLRKHSDLLN